MVGICSAASGEVLIEEFATQVGDPGITELPPGEYEIRFYSYVSDNTGITTLTFKNYARDYLGNENLLFQLTTGDINGLTTSYYTQLGILTGPVAIAASDRIVTKVYCATDNVGIITAHFVHSGSTPSNWRTAITQGFTGPQGIQGTQGTSIQGSQG